jgi:glutathione peroxidase
MKLLLSIMLFAATTTLSAQSIHGFTVKGIDGKDIKMSSFKGKKILVVNTCLLYTSPSPRDES